MSIGPALSFNTGVSGTGLNALNNLLQEWYEPILNEKIMNKQVVLFKRMGPKGRRREKFEGQRYFGASITQWPEGVGSRREGVFLPFPYASGAINPIMYSKDFYARGRFTGQVERATETGESGKGSWANAVKMEIKNIQHRAAEAIEHQLIVGKFGILGIVDTNIDTTASTALVMLNTASRVSGTPDTFRFGTQFLRHNQEWRIASAIDNDATIADTAGQSTFRAASSGLTFSWTGTTATTAGTTASDHSTGTSQYLIGHNTRPYTNGSTQITADQQFSCFHGLMEIVDTSASRNVYSSLYGLTRSTNPQMNAIRSDGTGTTRELTEAIISVVLDRAKNEGPGGDENVIDTMFAHDSIRFRYASMLTATRQFMSTDGKNIVRGGGFKDPLVYTGGGEEIPFVTGKDFPPGSIWCVAMPNFSWLYQSEPGFLKTDGVVRRFVPDYDQTEVVWHLDGNLWCAAPNANAVIDDLAFSTTDYSL